MPGGRQAASGERRTAEGGQAGGERPGRRVYMTESGAVEIEGEFDVSKVMDSRRASLAVA
jgi:hypothetical protein